MKKLRNRLLAGLAAVLSLSSSGIYSTPVSAYKTGTELMQQVKLTLPGNVAKSLADLTSTDVMSLWGEVVVQGQTYRNAACGKRTVAKLFNLPMDISKNSEEYLNSAARYAFERLTSDVEEIKIYSLGNGLLSCEDGRILTWGDVYPKEFWSRNALAKDALFGLPVLCLGENGRPNETMLATEPEKTRLRFFIFRIHPLIAGESNDVKGRDEQTFGTLQDVQTRKKIPNKSRHAPNGKGQQNKADAYARGYKEAVTEIRKSAVKGMFYGGAGGAGFVIGNAISRRRKNYDYAVGDSITRDKGYKTSTKFQEKAKNRRKNSENELKAFDIRD